MDFNAFAYQGPSKASVKAPAAAEANAAKGGRLLRKRSGSSGLGPEVAGAAGTEAAKARTDGGQGRLVRRRSRGSPQPGSSPSADGTAADDNATDVAAAGVPWSLEPSAFAAEHLSKLPRSSEVEKVLAVQDGEEGAGMQVLVKLAGVDKTDGALSVPLAWTGMTVTFIAGSFALVGDNEQCDYGATRPSKIAAYVKTSTGTYSYADKAAALQGSQGVQPSGMVH
jgi:hypothetical protein